MLRLVRSGLDNKFHTGGWEQNTFPIRKFVLQISYSRVTWVNSWGEKSLFNFVGWKQNTLPTRKFVLQISYSGVTWVNPRGVKFFISLLTNKQIFFYVPPRGLGTIWLWRKPAGCEKFLIPSSHIGIMSIS